MKYFVTLSPQLSILLFRLVCLINIPAMCPHIRRLSKVGRDISVPLSYFIVMSAKKLFNPTENWSSEKDKPFNFSVFWKLQMEEGGWNKPTFYFLTKYSTLNTMALENTFCSPLDSHHLVYIECPAHSSYSIHSWKMNQRRDWKEKNIYDNSEENQTCILWWTSSSTCSFASKMETELIKKDAMLEFPGGSVG